MTDALTDQTITLWAVDIAGTSILTYADIAQPNAVPAILTISQQTLTQLNSHYYAQLQSSTIHHAQTFVQYVADITALVAIGALQVSTTNPTEYHCHDMTLHATPYRHLVNLLPMPTLHQISHALQLMRWRADHRFCSRCGTPTHAHPHEYASVCPACDYHSYPRVQPCVITAIIKDTDKQPHILLALHHRHVQKTNPEQSMYGLIAGFVEIGESLESAVMRETKEETGLAVCDIRYIGSQPWPYPSNLMVGFIAKYAGGTLTPQADELYDARFFALEDLPIIPKTGTIARTLIDWVIADLGRTKHLLHH